MAYWDLSIDILTITAIFLVLLFDLQWLKSDLDKFSFLPSQTSGAVQRAWNNERPLGTRSTDFDKPKSANFTLRLGKSNYQKQTT